MRRGSRSRTLKTYNRKVARLKRKYKKLFEKSKVGKAEFEKLDVDKQEKRKKSLSQGRKNTRPFFCDKYKTFDDFLAIHQLKEVTRKESSISTTTTTRKRLWP